MQRMEAQRPAERPQLSPQHEAKTVSLSHDGAAFHVDAGGNKTSHGDLDSALERIREEFEGQEPAHHDVSDTAGRV